MDQLIKLSIATALWSVMLMTAGCAEIKPYDPPDYREEPPVHGLLTGSEGEFVIYRKADKPAPNSEAGKGADENADSEQQ